MNKFNILTCEGYKLFEGVMHINPVKGSSYDLEGTWLYKPDMECWYCAGRSFPAFICEIKSVSTPIQPESQHVNQYSHLTDKENSMQNAIDEAYRGIRSGHGGPFGSAIVKDGKIIALGHNHVVSNNDPTCHGEIDAIRKACKKLGTFDLSGCELYTSAEPCLMCLGAILWANIDKVYYGCTVKDTDEIGFRDEIFDKDIKELRANVEVPFMREECLKLFEEYKNIKDKTQY